MLFMYHPCAPTELVQRLRSLARGCLWKHLIFAFRGDFTEDHPVALVSYGTILKVRGLDINYKIEYPTSGPKIAPLVPFTRSVVI